MKRALICGISGQDGPYLAQLLLSKGYEVWGTSRDTQVSSFSNLEALAIRAAIKLESMSLNDFRSVLQCLIKVQPDEIYNLAGQSSVSLSFQQPVETLESISVGTMNLLEATRFIDKHIRFYNAGSSECCGLDWRNHVVVDEAYLRPTDIIANYANPEKAHIRLGWSATSMMHDVARMMVSAENNEIALD